MRSLLQKTARGLPLTLAAGLAALMIVSACSGGGQAPPTSTASTQTTPTPTQAAYTPPHNRPGPASDKVYFKAFNVDQAPLDFQNGNMDLYSYSLKTAAARDLRGNANIRLEEAPATSISVLLNPAPAPAGDLNPFSIKEVRQAVQSLINRDFISNDIYQGMALPQVTHLNPTNFDFLTIYDLVRSSGIRYDPEGARQQIQAAMTKAGAELVNGKWAYKGRPIRLKFIIRIEDERRDVGNLISAELQKAGFDVAPQFKPFADAVLSIYSSDPKSLEWHLYTEGWSSSAPSRYDYATINQMAAPWQGNMPGWKEAGFWQYENQDLDTLGQRLFRGEFKSQEERDDLYRRMTQAAMGESVRIWVTTVMNTFPVNKNMQGVTVDLVSGPKDPRTLRDAYIPGKDALTVGNLWVWTERTTWNPVGGFGDAYSTDILRNLYDPPMWNHPFTGLTIPYRTQFKVETAGPNGKMPVPTDSVVWDAKAGKWAPVGSNTQSVSKVVLDYSGYFGSKWHDGQQITMADVIYSIAQGYEIAYNPNKSKIEVALGATSRPYLETFRGYRIVDNHTLEVYVDFWHFEPSLIASYASPSGLLMPWELLAAMDSLVFDQRAAAYSDTASARFNVPWISLAMKKDAGMVERTLRTMSDKSTVPTGIFTIGNAALVSPQEAKARYQAAIDWYAKYGHLVITNGPFFLSRYDPPAQFAELTAFRDPSYPLHPGAWYLGTPPRVDISGIQKGKIAVGKAAQVSAIVTGPGTIGVRYVLLDPSSNTVVKSGDAAPNPGNKFTVALDEQATSGLRAGLYTLYIAAYSDQVASLTERKIDLDVSP